MWPKIKNRTTCRRVELPEKNLELPKEITSSLGTWVAGCDICQENCPWNEAELPSSEDPEMQPKEWILKLTKKQALSWSDSKWQEQLQGSALKRIKPWMWRRNAEAIQNDIG